MIYSHLKMLGQISYVLQTSRIWDFAVWPYRVATRWRRTSRKAARNPRWIVSLALRNEGDVRDAVSRSLAIVLAARGDDPLIQHLASKFADSLAKDDARHLVDAIAPADLSRRNWKQLGRVLGALGHFQSQLATVGRAAQVCVERALPESAGPEDIMTGLRAATYLESGAIVETLATRLEGAPLPDGSLQSQRDAHLAMANLWTAPANGIDERSFMRSGPAERLHRLIRGQNVAIVGNAADLARDHPLDGYDVVVRLNAYKLAEVNPDALMNHPNQIVYLNSGQSERLKRDLTRGRQPAKLMVASSRLVVLRADPPPGFANVISSLPAAPLFDNGPVIGMQAAFDALAGGAERVCLLGFDFNMTRFVQETDLETRIKLANQGILCQRHFTRSLWRHGHISADAKASAVLSLTDEVFAERLIERYGVVSRHEATRRETCGR